MRTIVLLPAHSIVDDPECEASSRQATLNFLDALLCCRQRVELILQLRTSRCARVGASRQRFSRPGEHRYSACDSAA